MVKASSSCHSLKTNAEKSWPYEEYYFGERDQHRRKNGLGENHWSGAESLQWYTGPFFRDTMHGLGEYRWRYQGPDAIAATFEGYFYGNQMHGYGTLSYPDGRVFNGLFHSNMRWGPGIETHLCIREDVGLWYGNKLMRLVWKPQTPSIAPDFQAFNNGFTIVEPHRVILAVKEKKLGKTNSAIDLLKHFGAEPKLAAERWSKLYPKYCTDLSSKLCQTESFERDYYNATRIPSLVEVEDDFNCLENDSQGSGSDSLEKDKYFSWNNTEVMINMMKHCFKHNAQKTVPRIDLAAILSGKRTKFKPADQHELNCRTLLMASYLGHIKNVAPLFSQGIVHPDVSDVQGNTALIYATCGDQVEIIHFLVEAGANVNCFNDNCCTPLGVALMRFVCVKLGIAVKDMVQSMLPPTMAPASAPIIPKALEWKIARTESPVGVYSVSSKRVSKTKPGSKNEQTAMKTEVQAPILVEQNLTEVFSAPKRLYENIQKEFFIRVTELFSIPSEVSPIPYIFEVTDMGKEIDLLSEEEKKKLDTKKKKGNRDVSREKPPSLKSTPTASKKKSEKEESLENAEQAKLEMLNRMMTTIKQLLLDGAKVNLVKCPNSALFMAVSSGCSELICHLINSGADVNEVYPQALGYTSLDMAISRSFTPENLEMIQVLLRNGAETNHRLYCGQQDSSEPNVAVLGPTLLHVLINRKIEDEFQEEIRRQIISLLLKHNCDPAVQFKGKSAIDFAMTKNLELLDIFIKCPKTNLNNAINDTNQSILLKMLYLPFFKSVNNIDKQIQILTDLLLFGADPLIQCQNGEDKYHNLFVYANTFIKGGEQLESEPETKAKKGKKGNAAKAVAKPQLKSNDVVMAEYKQALELVRECARMLLIRWLQAQLAKELIYIVYKYNHRWWNIILKEHKHRKRVSLWLTAPRCLEIWDILKTTKSKIYHDQRALKQFLCIVHYYSKFPKPRQFKGFVTAEEKDEVELDINVLLKEHKQATAADGPGMAKRPYVKPELAVRADDKFNVCFECALPFNETKILCISCKSVSFCSQECMRINVSRPDCHPCSDFLRKKYFPISESGLIQDN